MTRLLFRFFLLMFLTFMSCVIYAKPPVYEQRSYIKDGENETYFIKKYGSPTFSFVEPRYKFVGEFSVSIENTYRSTNPEFRNVPIKEMFWHFNDDLNLTCFFHYKDGQWVVISYAFWPPGANF